MKTKIELYFMSLGLLFVLLLIKVINIPVCFDKGACFIGWSEFLKTNTLTIFDAGDRKGYKFWKSAPSKILNADEMVDLFKDWISKYPIVSIEDPLDQNDWEGYAKMTKELGNQIQIVGDDFFVTNTKRLARGIEEGACNSILIKLNQIGTVTETIDAVRMAQKAGYTAVISHHSGETEQRDRKSVV